MTLPASWPAGSEGHKRAADLDLGVGQRREPAAKVGCVPPCPRRPVGRLEAARGLGHGRPWVITARPSSGRSL